MDDFKELITFLSNSNVEVRIGAIHGFSQYIKNKEFLNYIKEESLETLKTIVSLITDENLVNLKNYK
jgi:hypothetical protein